jgi:hypothetical protein
LSIVTVKANSIKKIFFFIRNLALSVREKLIKWYIWSVVLYGAETWILQRIRNTLKVLKCAAGEEL